MATQTDDGSLASNIPNMPKNRAQPPAGLKALIDHLNIIYPDQPNPLQVTTLLKYWLGGEDPLDYISMYYNQGDSERCIPPHWHYVSFGLSDLHGDGRVHQQNCNEFNTRSGMGFELTFRLLTPKEEVDNGNKTQNKMSLQPPTWPANLLQQIARYCFQTGNRLCVGDNIPWRKNLDGSVNNTNRIKNILIADDFHLGNITTPFGNVEFCQIVGVTEEELNQASRWNGRGVLNYLRQDTQTGGEWLVTDVDRKLSVFELFPETLLSLQDDLEKQGSDLAGVNADFTFREMKEESGYKKEFDSKSLNELWCASDDFMRLQELQHVKHEEAPTFPQSMSLSSNSLHKSCPIEYQPDSPDCVTLDGIEITLAPYAAKYLLLAIKDRLRHGRHFTFKSQQLALTLVAESVTGSIVNKSQPYGVLGYWVQVLITDDLIPRMIEDFQKSNLEGSLEQSPCIEFVWPEKRLKIIVDHPKIANASLVL